MTDGAMAALNNAALDRRLRDIPLLGDGLPRLREGPVMVIGAGNLGSRAARSLATLGVPLIIVDPGTVDEVNVGLQLFAGCDVGLTKTEALRRHLAQLRPDLGIECFAADVRRLGPRILSRCRLLLGCVDSFQARLWLCQMSAHLGIPYLDLAMDGTGRSVYGRASGFDPGRGAACIACSWDAAIWDEALGESGGAGCAALAGALPSAPPTLALPGLGDAIAGLGAVLAVRILLGWECDRVMGREWRLNLSTGRLEVVALKPSPRCRLSHRLWRARFLDTRPEAMTVGGLFAAAHADLGSECEVVLSAHDQPLVLAAGCPACRSSTRLLVLRGALPACPRCGGNLVPLNHQMRHGFRRSEVEDHLDATWRDLGLPAGGAVCASNGAGGELTFLLQE